MHTTKEEFNRLIAAAKLESAIKYLVDASGGTEWYNEAIMLSSAYEEHARKERLHIHDNAVIERNQIVYTATQLGNKVFGDTAGHHTPAVVGGFNIADFIKALVRAEGDWINVQTLTFPQADLTVVQRFLDIINAPGPDSWENAKRRGRLSLLYGYMKTLFGLTKDADLFIDTIKPIEDLLVLRSLNRAPNFNADILQIINKAEEHLRRLEKQEEVLRQQKATAIESLRQTYDRLRRLQPAATKHEDWVSLITRIVAENPTLANKFTKLQADVQALDIYSGLNLYNQLLTAGQPTIATRIEKAITLLEQAAEEQQI